MIEGFPAHAGMDPKAVGFTIVYLQIYDDAPCAIPTAPLTSKATG